MATLDKRTDGHVIVKICGITSVGDAVMAADAGADWLGINLWPSSPRYVTPEDASRISEAIRGRARIVGVFVDATLDTVEQAMVYCGIDLAQLHGNEPADLVRALGNRAIKAIRMEMAEPRFDPSVLLLIDANTPDYGGSGKLADWTAAAQLAGSHRVILAGGLTPENVAEAIRIVKPIGVDVASGVEDSPGRKNPERVRAFVCAAKEAL